MATSMRARMDPGRPSGTIELPYKGIPGSWLAPDLSVLVPKWSKNDQFWGPKPLDFMDLA